MKGFFWGYHGHCLASIVTVMLGSSSLSMTLKGQNAYFQKGAQWLGGVQAKGEITSVGAMVWFVCGILWFLFALYGAYKQYKKNYKEDSNQSFFVPFTIYIMLFVLALLPLLFANTFINIS